MKRRHCKDRDKRARSASGEKKHQGAFDDEMELEPEKGGKTSHLGADLSGMGLIVKGVIKAVQNSERINEMEKIGSGDGSLCKQTKLLGCATFLIDDTGGASYLA